MATLDWRRLGSTLVAFASLLTLLGVAGCSCNGDTAGTCDTTGDCPDSTQCIDGMCRPVCTTNAECARGPCVDSTCRIDEEMEEEEGSDTDGGEGSDDGGHCEGPCDCDPSCTSDDLGIDGDTPFDPESAESDGVGLDDDGALVLDSERINTNFIWIANTGASQVVKVDTETYEELGRYWTDPDPSRTTVNTFGDVYVGNRCGDSVTKISALGEDCPDTNGDGTITTSSGDGDILGSGPDDRFEDDCVLWHTSLGSGSCGQRIRAMAAQDVEGLDGRLTPYVWVGGYDTNTVWKLDGETGEILIETESPVRPYGFALDAAGNLWMSGLTGSLGKIDTTRCTDDAACAVEVCSASGAEDDSCDDAIKAQIPLPSPGYGITVDFNQRVWLGGWSGGNIKRYDPEADPGSRMEEVTAAPTNCNGIAADAKGFVYAACEGSNAIVRVDADSLDHRNVSTNRNRGIAIDAEGKVWGINRHSSAGAANVLTPGEDIDDHTVEVNVGPTLSTPYTYSDMTGLQLRLATNPRGYYRHLFQACPDDDDVEPEWGDLLWEAETPPGTSVTFRVKTADSRDALEDLEWLTVAEQPPDDPPVSIAAALEEAEIMPGRFLMLELVLRSERDSPEEVVTPRVMSINVQHQCPPTFG